MKTKLTLQLDANPLRDVRELATKEGTSIDALLTKTLKRVACERDLFNHAKARSLARLNEGMDLNWRPGSRDDVHER